MPPVSHAGVDRALEREGDVAEAAAPVAVGVLLKVDGHDDFDLVPGAEPALVDQARSRSTARRAP